MPFKSINAVINWACIVNSIFEAFVLGATAAANRYLQNVPQNPSSSSSNSNPEVCPSRNPGAAEINWACIVSNISDYFSLSAKVRANRYLQTQLNARGNWASLATNLIRSAIYRYRPELIDLNALD